MIRFTVYGKPQPQGSTRAFVKNGRAIVTSDNKNLKPWRQQISDTAFIEFGAIPYAGDGQEAIAIDLRFYFQAPKKRRMMPTVKPDLDKLIRAILDSLTGIAYRDDSQVVEVTARKFYSLTPHVEITVGLFVPED